MTGPNERTNQADGPGAATPQGPCALHKGLYSLQIRPPCVRVKSGVKWGRPVRTWWLNIGICLALAASPAFAGVCPRDAAPGDANGDRRVDILDLQLVVAALLGGVPDPRADVNGDGRVDIRDYQCLVGHANHADAQAPQAPDQPNGLVANVSGAAPHAPAPGRASFRLPAPACACLLRDAPAGDACRAVRARYTWCLTPHAPPARG